MRYQLVFQWPYSSLADYDTLIALEELVRNGLDDSLGTVDGHDYGSGEMNICIHTDEPQSAFHSIMAILSDGEELSRMKAGYRDFDEDDYRPIYPPELDSFSVA
jgi:hypothetical protein